MSSVLNCRVIEPSCRPLELSSSICKVLSVISISPWALARCNDCSFTVDMNEINSSL